MSLSLIEAAIAAAAAPINPAVPNVIPPLAASVAAVAPVPVPELATLIATELIWPNDAATAAGNAVAAIEAASVVDEAIVAVAPAANEAVPAVLAAWMAPLMTLM